MAQLDADPKVERRLERDDRQYAHGKGKPRRRWPALGARPIGAGGSGRCHRIADLPRLGMAMTIHARAGHSRPEAARLFARNGRRQGLVAMAATHATPLACVAFVPEFLTRTPSSAATETCPCEA